MTSQFFNRVKFQASTSGIVAFGVSAVVTGFRTPAGASVPDGAPVSYTAELRDPATLQILQWETGHGVYHSGAHTISRDTPFEGSSGTPVNFAQAPVVWLDFLAQDISQYRPAANGPYYVSTAGNDTTGTGSLSAPFLTLTRALNFVATLDGGGNPIVIGLVRTSNPVNYAGAQPRGFPIGSPTVILRAVDTFGARITSPDGGGVTIDDTVSGFSCFDILPFFSFFTFDHITFKPLTNGSFGVSHDDSYISTQFEGCMWDATAIPHGADCIAAFGGFSATGPGFAVYVSNAPSSWTIKGAWQHLFKDWGNASNTFGSAGTCNFVGTVNFDNFFSVTGPGSFAATNNAWTGTALGSLAELNLNNSVNFVAGNPPGLDVDFLVPNGTIVASPGGGGDYICVSPRIQLTNATTFYFRTDGLDSAARAMTATADTAGTAFKTPQFAYDAITNIYDFGQFPITIKAGNEAGTKTFVGPVLSNSWVGGVGNVAVPGFPVLTFQGNGSGNTIVTDSSEGDSFAILMTPPGNICLRAMTITSVTASCINNNSATTVILDTDIVFGTAASAHMLQSGPGGITWTGNYTVNGGASWHMLCGDGAIGDQFFPPFVSSVVTINGALTINAFAASSNSGAVVINATTYNVVGSVNGLRWQVNGGSIISTYNSTSLNFFPGNQNGVFDQGGGTYNPYPHAVTEAGSDYFYACNGNLLSDPNGHTFLWQGGFLGWSAANPVIVGPPASTFETGWARDGSYHIGQRSGTNAQKYDVYNTWTNASNWERFTIDWRTAANTVILGTEELGTGVARDMRLQTGGLEALRIDTSQLVTIGGFANVNSNLGGQSRFQVIDSGAVNYNTSFIQYSSVGIAGVANNYYRTLGVTPTSRGALTNGLIIGELDFFGDNGTNPRWCGQIAYYVDGVPAGTVMPSRLVISTGNTAGGIGGAPIEAMRIDTSQQIFVPGVSTTASAANAFLNNASTPANQLLRSTSSLRYKTRVSEVAAERIEAIAALTPIEYASLATADDQDTRFVGYAAERVAEIDPALVSFDAEGRPDGVMYDRVLLLQLEALRRRVNDLEKEKDSWRRQ